MFTESNPAQKFQIKQIHNKSEAVEGKLYYGYDDNKAIRIYRGTHEGRLKDETELIIAENNIINLKQDVADNKKDISNNITNISNNTIAIETKASKCFAIAMNIAL